MPAEQSRPDLAATLGFLHQTQAEGELVLEQNDGTRRFYLKGGDLCYLRSDVVGEQFGNYLIRLGVLDYNALKDLLAEAGARVGDKVVQWGLLTELERDQRLGELYESIFLHAVEHSVLGLKWNAGSLHATLGQDLEYPLEHRRVVWDVYQKMQTLDGLVEKFESEKEWRWRALPNLLDGVADLTLTPQLAYAITQLGQEPMGFDTIVSVTGLDPNESARLVASMWALGGIELAEGEVGHVKSEAAPSAPEGNWTPPVREHTQEVPMFQEDSDMEVEIIPPEEPPPILLDRTFGRSAPQPPQELAPDGSEVTPQLKAFAFFKQAEGLQLQGRTSEAIRALEQSVKLDPDSQRSYGTWMMLADLRQGNPAWSTRAIEAYQMAAKASPKKGEPWVAMGQLYHRKGFGTNATGCFRKAMELDPSLEMPDHAIGVERTVADNGGLFDRIKGMLGGDKK